MIAAANVETVIRIRDGAAAAAKMADPWNFSRSGATVTILTEILEEKKIHITADEATIMCLGIYEDTGSFTFPSTTAQDFNAAAFLLSCGANLFYGHYDHTFFGQFIGSI